MRQLWGRCLACALGVLFGCGSSVAPASPEAGPIACAPLPEPAIPRDPTDAATCDPDAATSPVFSYLDIRMSPGCSCTLVGCGHRTSFVARDATGAGRSVRRLVFHGASPTELGECPRSSVRGSCSVDQPVMTVEGAAACSVVDVTWDDGVTTNHVVRPRYVLFRPNGPGCAPTCLANDRDPVVLERR
jgi:hypothetical protein